MGCDIHWVLERKNGDEWIGLMSSDSIRCNAGSRFYSFFTELGLMSRGESKTALKLHGLPSDISGLSRMIYKDWAEDYHSASSLTLPEFTDAYKRALKDFSEDSETTAKELFGGWFDGDEYNREHRVVFWFDN
jgi:hypothetical protein